MKLAAAMAVLLLSLGMVGTCRAAPATPATAASQPQAAASTAPGIPFKREPETSASMVGRTAVALLVCLAIGGGVIYVLQRRMGLRPGLGLKKQQRRLQVVEMQRIAPKSTLVLVRWDQEELLLAQGEGGTSLLARAPAGTDSTTPGNA